jgi:hypothetical protein
MPAKPAPMITSFIGELLNDRRKVKRRCACAINDAAVRKSQGSRSEDLGTVVLIRSVGQASIRSGISGRARGLESGPFEKRAVPTSR